MTSTESVTIRNVDLANQFVELIRAQQAFQANARVITTGDELLTEVVNLRREFPPDSTRWVGAATCWHLPVLSASSVLRRALLRASNLSLQSCSGAWNGNCTKLLWVHDNHADISQCFLVINTLSRMESHCLIMFENSYDESPYQHELQKA